MMFAFGESKSLVTLGAIVLRGILDPVIGSTARYVTEYPGPYSTSGVANEQRLMISEDSRIRMRHGEGIWHMPY